MFYCEKCDIQFDYELYGPTYPGGKDREFINCPKCHENFSSLVTSQCLSVYEIKKDNNLK